MIPFAEYTTADSQCFSVGRTASCPYPWGSQPPSKTRSVGPTRDTTQTESWSVQPTHRPRDKRPHLCYVCKAA